MAWSVISGTVYGNSSDAYDVDLLIMSVEALQTQVMEIKSQYDSITSSLERIQLEIPRGLQNFPELFYLEGQNVIVGPDGIIYYDRRDIRDYVSILGSQSDNAGGNGASGPDQTRAGYVTTEQFNQLADLVLSLSTSCQTLSANLTSLQNTVNAISAAQSTSQASLQNLTAAYNQLNELCNRLTTAIKVNDDGSVVIAKSSPIVGRIEPATDASYWHPAVDGNWDRAGNTFRVSRDAQLESVTLYCDNVARILSPQNVYISACEINSGIHHIVEYSSALVNTSNFPKITYFFSSPVPVLADRDYLLCVKRTGNDPLYVYTCSNIRYGDFYKPYGASDEPRGGGDTPRSGVTPQQYFYEYLSACWSLTYTSQDIWSIFKFSEDESFTFNENGLTVENGNITVGGSEVVTSSSLGEMFLSLLSEYPDLLNSEINWDMFCDELKARLITTAGGSVTGPLSVNDLQINGRLILRLSPLLGDRESEDTPFLYQYPSIWAWDKICSKFNVGTNSYLQSITLYCDDASKILPPQSVYVSTGVSGANGDHQFYYWYCNSVNTNKFPLCTYSFADPVLIRSDRFHTLGVRKIGDNLIYPYVCAEYRNGGLYKPHGASEAEPSRDGSDPSAPGPRQEIPPEYPSMTLEEFMNMTFAYDWEHCLSSYELWSVLNFVEDIDFAFSDSGLAVESGNITVGGSEVVTSSNLSNIFISVFSNNPNITWDMFCQELKDYLINTSGGTVTGCLNVTHMKFNAETDWKIGDSDIRSDIVLLNENAKIRSNAGDLKLSAPEGDKISAESFLSFESSGQAGIITIQAEQKEKSVSCLGITDQAVILLTPRQPISNIWWSVQSVQSNACFKITIDKTCHEDLSFNYLIIRK